MCMNKNGAIINIRPWLRWKIHLRLDYECSKYFNRNIIHFKMNVYHTRMWEWSAILSMLIEWSEAYPTYVGMIPARFQESEVAHVYPMYVGMTRRSAQSSVKFVGSSHACGNDSNRLRSRTLFREFIPRVWEWFVTPRSCLFYDLRLSHVCGNVSPHFENVMKPAWFIPRKWEWFKDCRNGDNFVSSFSHACGSVLKAKDINTSLFMREWFAVCIYIMASESIFPRMWERAMNEKNRRTQNIREAVFFMLRQCRKGYRILFVIFQFHFSSVPFA